CAGAGRTVRLSRRDQARGCRRDRRPEHPQGRRPRPASSRRQRRAGGRDGPGAALDRGRVRARFRHGSPAVKRADVIDAFAAGPGDAVVITGPGASSGMLYLRDNQPATIYNMELAYATAMCLGIALGDPTQRVVAIEGDGSLTAELQVLTTIA